MCEQQWCQITIKTWAEPREMHPYWCKTPCLDDHLLYWVICTHTLPGLISPVRSLPWWSFIVLSDMHTYLMELDFSCEALHFTIIYCTEWHVHYTYPLRVDLLCEVLDLMIIYCIEWHVHIPYDGWFLMWGPWLDDHLLYWVTKTHTLLGLISHVRSLIWWSFIVLSDMYTYLARVDFSCKTLDLMIIYCRVASTHTLWGLISRVSLWRKKARSVDPGVAPTKWKKTCHFSPALQIKTATIKVCCNFTNDPTITVQPQ